MKNRLDEPRFAIPRLGFEQLGPESPLRLEGA
jgi:hypothetical protein